MSVDDIVGAAIMAAPTGYRHSLAEIQAEAVARRVLAGLDRSENAMIWHTEAVVALARHLGPAHVTVAWLHDVVEDSDLTLGDLRKLGFSKEVIDAVDAISRREGEFYLNYIFRCGDNRLAREVKLADIRHNAFELRLRQLPDDEAKGLRKRYARAEEMLMEKQLLHWYEEKKGN